MFYFEATAFIHCPQCADLYYSVGSEGDTMKDEKWVCIQEYLMVENHAHVLYMTKLCIHSSMTDTGHEVWYLFIF